MHDFISRRIDINTYFDKIFYINLKKDTERNNHMLQQFQQYGIHNFERIEAIELKEKSPKTEYRNFIKMDDKYVIGSLSCRQSHINCIKLALERNYQKIMILEDDVVIRDDINIVLTRNYEILQDWDVIYFNGLIEHYFRNQIVGAYAYALNHTVFADIINMAISSGMEIDNFYAKILQHMSYNYNQSGKYNIRILLPFNSIVHPDSFNSNIRD